LGSSPVFALTRSRGPGAWSRRVPLKISHDPHGLLLKTGFMSPAFILLYSGSSQFVREFGVLGVFCGCPTGQFGVFRQVQIDIWLKKNQLSRLNPIFPNFGKYNRMNAAQSEFRTKSQIQPAQSDSFILLVKSD